MSASKREEKISGYPVASLTKRVLQLFRERLDQKLRPKGVTAAQLHVLSALEREPGISGARLARTCMVTPQTTQVLIRTIEANGWIRRSRHPENDRILLATLTPAGKRILAQSRAGITHIYAEMLEGFTARDIAALEEMLGRCAENLAP
jgi:DNA-binding MarR family transcriptional regulator